MTIAFGHGISVTPLHLATGVAAMVNGGILYPPTFVKRSRRASEPGRRVIQAKTSQMDAPAAAAERDPGHRQECRRQGLRGRRQDRHGGKAEPRRLPPKSPNQLVRWHVPDERAQVPRRWSRSTSRKGIAETGGYATGGMVSAPSVKAIIENIIALYGILPGDWSADAARDRVDADRLRAAAAGAGHRRGGRGRAAASARRCRRRRVRRRSPECVALRLSELMGRAAAARSRRWPA